LVTASQCAATPPIAAQVPQIAIKIAIGRMSDATSRFGHGPTRATRAKGTPRMNPTHHVATMPQPRPKSVGDVVSQSGSWPIVKYSTHIRAVTWSCAIP